jgi:hypothetical protein
MKSVDGIVCLIWLLMLYGICDCIEYIYIYNFLIHPCLYSVCKKTHVPAGAHGLGDRPRKHSMASMSASPRYTTNALSR